MKRLSLSLLALLLLCGCARSAAPQGAEAESVSSTIFAMDTVMDLRVCGDERLLLDAAARIADLERALSVTDPGSEIYAVNRDGRGELGEDAAALLERALAVCARTDGALDVSVYPVVRAWGFTTGDYRVPDAEELHSLLQNVDYRQIALDGSSVTLRPGMMLDLGSVAKGYASDQVLALFQSAGVTSALLNLGGNVHALGGKPDGSDWRIAIQDPLGSGYLGLLEIRDRAVITSGGYERSFEEDGEVYWHIIDPATGAPARSGLISVSVVGRDGTLCDGLSTALFVMGLERAAALWRASDDFEAIFVTDQKEIYITQGLEGNFRTAGNYENTQIQVIRRDEN